MHRHRTTLAAMKHASESALDSLAPLLEQLRSMNTLVEKSAGVFYRKSKPFLLFHENRSGILVDVRPKPEQALTRLSVTTPKQQAAIQRSSAHSHTGRIVGSETATVPFITARLSTSGW